jgi:CheY-like chemotaxis protein
VNSQVGLQAAGAAGLAGLRVFVVEDETLVAMLLEDMIADLGGVVVASAARRDRALEIARDRTVAMDVAVLDVNLGGEEAFPVADALAERGTPFVFSTGYGGNGLPEPWRLRPILQKPFTQDQVEIVLREAAGKARGNGS